MTSAGPTSRRRTLSTFTVRLVTQPITATQPSYLHNLISLQPYRSTRSSSVDILFWPTNRLLSSLQATDHSLLSQGLMAELYARCVLSFCHSFVLSLVRSVCEQDNERRPNMVGMDKGRPSRSG